MAVNKNNYLSNRLLKTVTCFLLILENNIIKFTIYQLQTNLNKITINRSQNWKLVLFYLVKFQVFKFKFSFVIDKIKIFIIKVLSDQSSSVKMAMLNM